MQGLLLQEYGNSMAMPLPVQLPPTSPPFSLLFASDTLGQNTIKANV
jgi:hypothetical protein